LSPPPSAGEQVEVKKTIFSVIAGGTHIALEHSLYVRKRMPMPVNNGIRARV
jgi:hypothetical protein